MGGAGQPACRSLQRAASHYARHPCHAGSAGCVLVRRANLPVCAGFAGEPLLAGRAGLSLGGCLAQESARMSGSSPVGTLVRVTIPLLAPAILGACVLAFVQALQSFEPELVLA